MKTKATLNIKETKVAKTKISLERETSVVEVIIKNAPAKKTWRGTEKKILLSELKKKYGS